MTLNDLQDFVAVGSDYLIVTWSMARHRPTVAEVCAAGRRAGFPCWCARQAITAIRLAIGRPLWISLACVESSDDSRSSVTGHRPRGRRRPEGWEIAGPAAFRHKPGPDSKIISSCCRRSRPDAGSKTRGTRHRTTTALRSTYDLSAELGVCGDMDSPVLREALAAISASGDSVGKATWMIGSNAAQLARDGWRFICIGEPTWILMSALRDKVAQARDAKK